MNHERIPITITVNGTVHNLEIPVRWRLLDVLREQLGLTGAKEGCGQGECGTCTVLLNGRPVNSCLVPAPQADGAQILTVEGIGSEGKLHPIQQALIDEGGVQCGFCTPGVVVTAFALLQQNPDPSEPEIRRALAGNLCRCTGYSKIVSAVRIAARTLREAEADAARNR